MLELKKYFKEVFMTILNNVKENLLICMKICNILEDK